jgi:hypothetical protein
MVEAYSHTSLFVVKPSHLGGITMEDKPCLSIEDRLARVEIRLKETQILVCILLGGIVLMRTSAGPTLLLVAGQLLLVAAVVASAIAVTHVFSWLLDRYQNVNNGDTGQSSEQEGNTMQDSLTTPDRDSVKTS